MASEAHTAARRATIAAAVPGVRLLTSYRRSWLPKDIVAGLVLTALLAPQGMAYAGLAGLPTITGLYTPIMCSIEPAAMSAILQS